MGGAVVGYRMLQTVQQFGVFVREVIQQLRQCSYSVMGRASSHLSSPAQFCSQDRTVLSGSTSALRGEPVCEES